MSNVYELQPRFTALFDGLDSAFGTGRGQWVKRPPRPDDWIQHLQGIGPGIGIAPLRPDNTVRFAAIDLDEPDFDAAREMQKFIPGDSFIERSRSGNAHVWVFFSAAIEAWVPMGILKEVTLSAGKKHVEVFPKNHDFNRVRLGNYINLPYHGDQRWVLKHDAEPVEQHWHPDRQEAALREATMFELEEFLDAAEAGRNDPAEWIKRADWLLLTAPTERTQSAEFGTQTNLHICADALISGDTPPPAPGHRSNVFFMLAKCLTNWSVVDHDEALDLMRGVNERSDTPIPDSEIRRILGNAERGRYTSTGCDDPVVTPYTHPDCPIVRSSDS